MARQYQETTAALDGQAPKEGIVLKKISDLEKYSQIIGMVKDMIYAELDEAQASLKYWDSLLNKDKPKELNGIQMDGMPKGSRNFMSLDRVVQHIKECQERISETQNKLQRMLELEKEMLAKALEIEDLDMKVVIMRDVLGYKLQDIAEMLGFTEQWIKMVSARNKNEYTKDYTDTHC